MIQKYLTVRLDIWTHDQDEADKFAGVIEAIVAEAIQDVVTPEHRDDSGLPFDLAWAVYEDEQQERIEALEDENADTRFQAERAARIERLNAKLIKRIEALEQYLRDTSDDLECLDECDSYAHAEGCPVADPMAAFRTLRERIEALEEALSYAIKECEDPVIAGELYSRVASSRQQAGGEQ